MQLAEELGPGLSNTCTEEREGVRSSVVLRDSVSLVSRNSQRQGHCRR